MMNFFTIRMPDDLISLIKATVVIIGARNVSAFVRGVLLDHCLKILREKGVLKKVGNQQHNKKNDENEP